MSNDGKEYTWDFAWGERRAFRDSLEATEVSFWDAVLAIPLGPEMTALGYKRAWPEFQEPARA